MPMCSRTDAKCLATGSLIKNMYKCPFEYPCFYCDVCDECNVSDEIENPVYCEYDEDDEDEE